jgi:2-oxoisovalerate dehydrogenase E1 component
LEAAAKLEKGGLGVAVLDLRWLCPLDEDGLLSAVRDAGGHAVVLHEANRTGGFGAEVVARLHELLGAELDLHITRVATQDMRIPAAPILQRALLPTADNVVDAVEHLLRKQLR